MASILSLILLLVLQTLLLAPIKTYSQDNPLLTDCAGDTNYTVPSIFSSSLDLLLSNLTSSPRAPGYFSTATAGASSSAPAYGLAQCRPDVSATNCSICLNRSASAAATGCPHRKSATIRFDYCVLRFSDQRFFGQLENDQPLAFLNGNNASDPMVFNPRMKDLMDEIASQAAASESRFGVGSRITPILEIYTGWHSVRVIYRRWIVPRVSTRRSGFCLPVATGESGARS